MTLILRMIRQHRWDRPANSDWLDDDDVPADPLADFANTSENRLSVWLVDDDKKNLRQVVAAMAAAREKLDKLDYVLFPRGYSDGAGITCEEVLGDTPDDQANVWHRDLVGLSANKVVALTKMVWKQDNDPKRISKTEAKELIIDAVLEGRIPLAKLSRKLHEAIGSIPSGGEEPPRIPR